MKVLHICTQDSGGAGLCCLRIHKSLLQQGIDSKVLVFFKNSNCQKVYQCDRIKCFLWKVINKISHLLRLNITDFNKIQNICLKRRSFYSSPCSFFDVSTNQLVQQADIIHLHWINNFIDYPSFFDKVDKPFVWTLHDENLFYGIAHYSKDLLQDHYLEQKYYKIKYASIRRIKKLGIVFLSKMMHDAFSNNVMIKGRSTTIINNSVDYNKFHPIKKEIARTKFSIPKDSLVFIFVAASINDKRKGLEILAETVRKMNIPNSLILAVGNVPDNFSLPNVLPVGPIYDSEQMSVAYSCADYFVMPSYQEAFAQTPLEAMACGIPVIVFPVSGTEELITEDNGIRTKGFTSNDLEKGINIALSHTYESEKIRKDVIKRFSPEITANKYIEFYKTILGDENY